MKSSNVKFQRILSILIEPEQILSFLELIHNFPDMKKNIIKEITAVSLIFSNALFVLFDVVGLPNPCRTFYTNYVQIGSEL